MLKLKRLLIIFVAAIFIVVLFSGCPVITFNFKVTVSTSPITGFYILIDGASFSSPETVEITPGTSLILDVVSPQDYDSPDFTLFSGKDTRYAFQKWSDNVITKARTVIPVGNKTYTAEMIVSHYMVKSFSRINSVDELDESSLIIAGNQAQFFATNVPGNDFGRWEVNGIDYGKNNPLILTINGPKKVVAVYVSAENNHDLTVGTLPDSGLKINIGGVEYTSPKTVNLPDGEIINIGIVSPQEVNSSVFVPGNDKRYEFFQWNDAVTSKSRFITVNSDISYTANMSVKYRVETSTSPEEIGGITGADWYNAGNIANINAAATSGNYIFDRWEINGVTWPGINNLNLAVNNPKKVVAVYKLVGSATIKGTIMPYTGNVTVPSYVSWEGQNQVEPERVFGEYIILLDEQIDLKEVELPLEKLKYRGVEIKDSFQSESGELRVIVVKAEENDLETLKEIPGVVHIEPNYIYRALGIMPNDPYYSDQSWHYEMVQLPDVWEVTKGSRIVVVAVLDTGVRFDHPDLQGVFYQGYDVIEEDTDPTDVPSPTSEMSHGTHVSGTIAALTNNGVGVAGIAWGGVNNLKIMPVRILDYDGRGTAAWLAKGIIYAVDHGAQILNMSLGGGGASAILEQAVDYAYGNGVIVVCASGNESEPVLYPAAYSSTFAIGAVGPSMNRASYSNFGPEVDFVGPGGDSTDIPDSLILSTSYSANDGNTYTYMAGTSMAAPHVSGVIGLLMSQGYTGVDEIYDLLKNTSIDLGGPGKDNYYGWGLIQAYDALLYPDVPYEPFVVWASNPVDINDLISSTPALSDGYYVLDSIDRQQVKLYSWRDSNHNDLIDTGDLFGYYGYNGGPSYPSAASIINISPGETLTRDFSFAPIIDDTDRPVLTPELMELLIRTKEVGRKEYSEE